MYQQTTWLVQPVLPLFNLAWSMPDCCALCMPSLKLNAQPPYALMDSTTPFALRKFCCNSQKA
ncbi:hypothetical protein, partial [Comamonas sp.]|uniref:hypothetical protein n=1 Tax=Comamonas sp. TaxID=34028 RepID=UPI002FC7D824